VIDLGQSPFFTFKIESLCNEEALSLSALCQMVWVTEFFGRSTQLC